MLFQKKKNIYRLRDADPLGYSLVLSSLLVRGLVTLMPLKKTNRNSEYKNQVF
jgi:hypothetical protein